MTELGKSAKRMGHPHPRVLRQREPEPPRATPAAKPHRKAFKPFGWTYEHWGFKKVLGGLYVREWQNDSGGWFETADQRDKSMKSFQHKVSHMDWYRNIQPVERSQVRRGAEHG